MRVWTEQEIEQRNLLLRSLVGDTRLPAILDLINWHEEEFTAAGSRQQLAGDGNKQSHALGSVYALRTFQEDLLRLVHEQDPERSKRTRKRGAEGQDRPV